MKKITVAITGASGVNLATSFIKALPCDIETNVIISDNAKIVFERENNIKILDNQDISQRTASGSYKNDAMVVIPCSTNTLAKISCGIADNLITRSAAVMLKEKKPLLLAPREIPFGIIALKQMYELAQMGVIIAPAVLGYYSKPKTLEDMENFLIGKWFDLLGIENDLYERWQG